MSNNTPAKRPQTAPDVAALKNIRRMSMITAYDYPTGALVENSGADIILVGDSLAMVVLGHENTLSLTMDDMLHHAKAVRRGAPNSFIVGDMPFMSYESSVQKAVENAARFLKEAGMGAVKIESTDLYLEQAKSMVRAGIPVQGHLGLTPQRVAGLGGFKVQANTAEAGRLLVESAKAVEDAGCFSLVLEAVPAPVAKAVTEAVSIPTIGIGAGPHCDGQVLVFHDLLGLYSDFSPKFVKQYANLAPSVTDALTAYHADVVHGAFPGEEHCFSMPEDELQTFLKSLS